MPSINLLEAYLKGIVMKLVRSFFLISVLFVTTSVQALKWKFNLVTVGPFAEVAFILKPDDAGFELKYLCFGGALSHDLTIKTVRNDFKYLAQKSSECLVNGCLGNGISSSYSWGDAVNNKVAQVVALLSGDSDLRNKLVEADNFKRQASKAKTLDEKKAFLHQYLAVKYAIKGKWEKKAEEVKEATK